MVCRAQGGECGGLGWGVVVEGHCENSVRYWVWGACHRGGAGCGCCDLRPWYHGLRQPRPHRSQHLSLREWAGAGVVSSLWPLSIDHDPGLGCLCTLQVELVLGPKDLDPGPRRTYPECALPKAWGRDRGGWGLARVSEEQTNPKNGSCHPRLETAPSPRGCPQTGSLQSPSYETNLHAGNLNAQATNAGVTSLWFIFLQVAGVPRRNP